MVEMRREPYRDDAEALSARLHSSLSRTAPRSPTEALQPEPVPPPPPRSRAVRHPMVVFLNLVITVIVIGILAIGGGVFFAKSQFDSASTLDTARSFTVAHGTGVSTIADELVKDGIIDTKWLFVFGVWLSNQTSSLKAGEYLIPAHASMRDIMDTMVTGKGILYSVTIPEGLTSQQVVDRLNADQVLTGEIKTIPAEGSLLPETYKFTRGDARQDIIDRMQRERDRVLADVWSRRAPDLPIKTPAALVTLASIVEKETALADERSRVAAVFINRLKLNMRLQSDPTVLYGMFGGAGKPSDFTLTRKDLETPTRVQHLRHPRLAAGADRQSRPRLARGGRQSLAHARPLLRRRRQRRPRLRPELRGPSAQCRPLARFQRQQGRRRCRRGRGRRGRRQRQWRCGAARPVADAKAESPVISHRSKGSGP